MYFLGVATLSSVLGLIIVYVDYKQRATQSMRERIMGTLIASSEKESSDLLRKAIEDLNTKINEEIQALTDDAISIQNVTAAYIEELKHNQERDFAVLENSTNKDKPLQLKKENFYANETTLNPSNCLLLQRGKKGRYRNVCRDQKILTTMIKTP